MSGIYPAFLTPLDGQKNFAPSVAARLFEWLMETGVDGTYVAGSTGEGLLLPVETRKALVETLTPLLPKGRKLMVHVGAHEVETALELARHAAEQGAQVVSSLPPAGGRDAVRTYYERLAKESPLPLILYYFPRAAPDAFGSGDELIELAGLPNVLGVKFTDFNLYLLQRLVAQGKTVFNGYDEVLAAGLLMGAQGGIGSTYNVMPQAYLQIARAARQGEWETARLWQQRVNRVIEVLVRYPFTAALRIAVRTRGFDCGPNMAGQVMTREEQARLLAELDVAMMPELKDLIGWRGATEN